MSAKSMQLALNLLQDTDDYLSLIGGITPNLLFGTELVLTHIIESIIKLNPNEDTQKALLASLEDRFRTGLYWAMITGALEGKLYKLAFEAHPNRYVVKVLKPDDQFSEFKRWEVLIQVQSPPPALPSTSTS